MGGSNTRNSTSGTPTSKDYVKPPQTPPPRRPPPRLGSRMRSDSSVSAIIMTPDQPSTPVAGINTRPLSSSFLDNEQDMADLTAEMALLDDGYDTRTGRTISSRAGGGLRPLSLQYKPSTPTARERPVSGSSDSDNHDEVERGAYTPTTRSSAPTFYALGGNVTPTSLSYPEKPGTPISSLTTSRLLNNIEKTLYRLRVVLRLLSIMGAGCVLGVLSHITAVYERTKDKKDEDTEEEIWPLDGLDLIPTHMILAGAAVCLVAGMGWTGASVIQRVRRLDASTEPWIRWIAGLSAAFEMLLWIVGIGYAGRVKGMPADKRDAPTLFWVCEARNALPRDENGRIIDQEVGEVVDFNLHCGEIQAAWFAAIVVSTVTGVILLTIIGGHLVRWWHRRRKGKGRMLSMSSAAFEEVPQSSSGGRSGLRGLRLVGGGKANIGGMGRKWAWGKK